MNQVLESSKRNILYSMMEKILGLLSSLTLHLHGKYLLSGNVLVFSLQISLPYVILRIFQVCIDILAII